MYTLMVAFKWIEIVIITEKFLRLGSIGMAYVLAGNCYICLMCSLEHKALTVVLETHSVCSVCYVAVQY